MNCSYKERTFLSHLKFYLTKSFDSKIKLYVDHTFHFQLFEYVFRASIINFLPVYLRLIKLSVGDQLQSSELYTEQFLSCTYALKGKNSFICQRN